MDVISMAISNIWRGVCPLPPIEQMETEIDSHQAWVAKLWKIDSHVDASIVNRPEWQKFLPDAARTWMENMGWGLKGWKFWLQDRKMSNLICN